MFVTILRFRGMGFALVTPSHISVRMQQQISTKALSISSSVDETKIEADLLEPNAVSSKVFSSDKRPVILFDGGTFLHVSLLLTTKILYRK